MTNENIRLQYIKNVLGIKSVILPKDFRGSSAVGAIEFSFQTSNQGPVLFLSHFEDENDKKFSVEELQLLEKIIVALKLNFQKTDIAKVKASSTSQLVNDLQSKNYSYIFLLGEDISKQFGQKNEFTDSGLRFFPTFHPQEMIQNPELKKNAWAGFKSIMENLPR
jgi:hypothetical protein